MDYRFVLYEKSEWVAKVTVNRPEVKNAMSPAVYDEIDDAFSRAERDPEVKVIVVAGAGDNFGAGHDIGSKELLEDEKAHPPDTTPAGSVDRLYKYYSMRDKQRNLSKPTVAMVQGWCIMGSWMLASACDLIVASEDAKFADWAVRRGRSNVEYSTLFWEAGLRQAKEHLWTGEPIDGKQAWRLGIVNRAVPRDQLETETMALAKKIALNDPVALRLSKVSLNQAADVMGQSAAMKAAFHMWALTSGFNVNIKPEGTRSPTEEPKAKAKPSQ